MLHIYHASFQDPLLSNANVSPTLSVRTFATLLFHIWL